MRPLRQGVAPDDVVLWTVHGSETDRAGSGLLFQMSPAKLSLCLHYHSSVVDDPWIDSGARIVDDTMLELINDGLLTDEGPGALRASGHQQRFRATQKLHAFVAMLEVTPFPNVGWYDPRNKRILEGPGLK